MDKQHVIGWDIETHTPVPEGKRKAAPDPWNPGSFIISSVMVSPGWVPIVADYKNPTMEWKQTDEVLNDPNAVVVGHNIIAFDSLWWRVQRKKKISATLYDTMILHSLIDEDSRSNSLDDLAKRYLGVDKKTYGLDRQNLINEPIDKVLKYNLSDARLHLRLYNHLWKVIQENKLEKLASLMMRAATSMLDMTIHGAWVDVKWAKKMKDEIGAERDKAEATLRKFVGDKFNLKSNKQLSGLLFSVLGAPVVKRSKKTGTPSVDEDSLKRIRLRAGNPTAQKFLTGLLEYKKASKLLSTYLKPLVDKHPKADGRVHPTIHLGRSESGGTKTGRLSMSNPNLQNIPNDARVRGVIAAPKGYRLFVADFAQIEICLAAHLSQDPTWMKAIKEGKDIHSYLLSMLERIPYEQVVKLVEVDSEWHMKRKIIKNVNFGILYGASPWTIQRTLLKGDTYVTLGKIKSFMDRWTYAVPQVMKWREREKDDAVRNKVLYLPTGRPRHLPLAQRGTPSGEAALRQGVNFRVQGMAAEINNTAVMHLSEQLRGMKNVNLIATVHDSVVGEYKVGSINDKRLRELIQKTMVTETLATLKELFDIEITVPLRVEIETGLRRWA